jgi:hypothetical protein
MRGRTAFGLLPGQCIFPAFFVVFFDNPCFLWYNMKACNAGTLLGAGRGQKRIPALRQVSLQNLNGGKENENRKSP